MPAEFQLNVASVFVDEYPYDLVNYRALTESHRQAMPELISDLSELTGLIGQIEKMVALIRQPSNYSGSIV